MTAIDAAELALEYAATDGEGAPAYERIKRIVSERIRAGAPVIR